MSHPPDGRDPPTPLGPDLWANLVAIDRALTDLPADAELAEKLEWVVNVMVLRGHLTEGHRKILRHVHAPTSRAQLSSIDDKHAVGGAEIDCDSLIHLCLGRCCTFKVDISRADVAEGKLRWDIDEPYVLPRTANGYCANVDDDARCRVYDDRPGVCRVYDCRGDERVWLDFDARIPAPLSPRVVPLERLRRRGPI